jgi:UDP-N-acetylmuramate--alanine ligase
VNLAAVGRVHFIGVSGAGMSALAKVLLERGVAVSGSDLKRARASTTLEAMGAEVTIGHDGALVEGAGAVVVSAAIPEHNVELRAARDLGVPVVTRGEALASVLDAGRPIVVAGTHGKTTTTSMIVSILRSAGLDPTFLVGGGLNDAGTNARSGRDDWIVAESDESDGSFLLLRSHIAVVTNMEMDHVDYWPSLDALREGFARFLAATHPQGVIVLPAGDPYLSAAARRAEALVVRFGPQGDVTADDIEMGPGATSFVLAAGNERVPVRLAMPGRHNIQNALAAAAACRAAGLDIEAVAEGLASYRGVERRFQPKGKGGGVTVIDDYAHHPTEVRAALAAARSCGWRRVVAVFQPHRYTRTIAFRDELGAAFADADHVVVTDIFGAGEAPVPGVSGKLVAEAVGRALPRRRVAYLPHRGELIDYLAATARPGDGVLTLGAGDITSAGDELLPRLRAGRRRALSGARA